jgi:3-oxoacyl-[acyl-carrier-protein] synthase III
MTKQPVGIRSLAVAFPSVVRRNDYFQEHFPDLLAGADKKSLAKVFSSAAPASGTEDIWAEEMRRYAGDPFRGAVERRVLGPGESSLTLERRAALDALAAARLTPGDVDLMLVSSVFPEHPGPGNAAWLAGELGLTGAAWNVDSMCASPLVSLQNACAQVRAGEFKNVLVVASCTYSRHVDSNDTLSLVVGDGAGAFVVGELGAGLGVLGTKIVHTAATCGSFYCALENGSQGDPRMLVRVDKERSKRLPELSLEYLRACCDSALAAAGVTIDQIDYVACYTATAWYAPFFTRAMGLPPDRTMDTYPRFGNISAASVMANLYFAAQLGKIKPGDLILVYNHGFVASSVAVVMRWGEVALGPSPDPVSTERPLSGAASPRP